MEILAIKLEEANKIKEESTRLRGGSKSLIEILEGLVTPEEKASEEYKKVEAYLNCKKEIGEVYLMNSVYNRKDGKISVLL